MPFASLYQKYRPQTFSEIVGQRHVARTLANAVERGHIFHAYLFSGPRGTGKTSTARILAKAVNCEKGPTPEPCGTCQPCTEIAAGTFSDVFEIDAATHSKVEETRDFLSNVPTGLSALSRKKFYIVDEVHMLSSHAFNALLKTLEEPPDHVVFVLATTEPHKVPPTITGRCQHFEFRLIPPSDLYVHYQTVCGKEGVEYEQEAVEKVAALARGSVRDGLSLLDQLVAATGGRITAESVSLVVGDDEVDLSAALTRSIATGDLEKCLELTSAVAESGRDYRAFAQCFAAYLRDLMVASYLPARQTQAVAGVDPQTAAELSEIARLLGRPTVLRCLDIAGQVLASIASGSPPQLALELGIVRMCRPEESPPVAELAKRLDELNSKLARLERRVSSRPEPLAVEEVPASEPVPASNPRQPGSPLEPEKPEPKPHESEVASGALQEQWILFLDALKKAKKMKAHAVLQEAHSVEIEDSTLVLEFAQKYEYHAKNAESLGGALEEQIKAVFGRPLRIVSCLIPEAGADSSAGAGVATGDAENRDDTTRQGEATAQEIAERLIVQELGGTPVPSERDREDRRRGNVEEIR